MPEQGVARQEPMTFRAPAIVRLPRLDRPSLATAPRTGFRRLVINADDLGFSDGVNRGIFQAYDDGVVTSASLMVGLPGWDDALRRVRVAPFIGIGLHLNVLVGEPLTDAPSLIDQGTGRFLSLAALAGRAVTGRIVEREVRDECEAQLSRLLDAGVRVTHIDSHRHPHALPGLWRPVVEVARDHRIPVVRVPIEPAWVNPGDWRATIKKLALRASHVVAARGSPTVAGPRHFYGVSLQGGTCLRRRLLRLIDRMPDGTAEIMVHPGYPDDVLYAMDSYSWQRLPEIDVLCGPELREQLVRRGIELVHFGEL